MESPERKRKVLTGPGGIPRERKDTGLEQAVPVTDPDTRSGTGPLGRRAGRGWSKVQKKG